MESFELKSRQFRPIFISGWAEGVEGEEGEEGGEEEEQGGLDPSNWRIFSFAKISAFDPPLRTTPSLVISALS